MTPIIPPRRHTVLVGAAAILAACGGAREPATPPTPERLSVHPAPASYHGVTHGYVEQTFEGQMTSSRFGVRYFLHTDASRAGEATEVRWVIDSLLPVPGTAGSLTKQQADSAHGATYEAVFTSAGELTEFAGGLDAGAPAEELAGRILRDFFPRLPQGGAAVGETWLDTVEVVRTQNGMENVVRSINAHTAGGWVDHGGVQALLVETVATYTFDGSGTESGQEFTLQGSGRRHTSQYVAASGQYLGFTAADTSEAEAQMLGMGIVIPVRQERIDSLSIRWP